MSSSRTPSSSRPMMTPSVPLNRCFVVALAFSGSCSITTSRYEAPSRVGPIEDNDFEGFAVVPTTGVPNPIAIRDSLRRALEKLDWLKSLAPDPTAQTKYKKAHRWLYAVSNSWGQIAYWVERFAEEDREK